MDWSILIPVILYILGTVYMGGRMSMQLDVVTQAVTEVKTDLKQHITETREHHQEDVDTKEREKK